MKKQNHLSKILKIEIMRIKFLILLFFGLNSIFSNESNESIEQTSLIDSFEKGNLLYNNAQYVESLENYNEIIDSGYQSAELFYNIGNCYYKINDVANAILFYERSILISPADEDVRNNLQMVRNSLIDDIDQVPESFFISKLNSISALYSHNAWGIFCIVLSFVFLLLFNLYYFSNSPIMKRSTFLGLIFLFLIILIVLRLGFNSLEKNYIEKYAIIFAQKIEIKEQPNLRSDNILQLHKGSKVKVIDEFNEEWSKIKLANGQEGWIRNNEIKII
tara:strand:+ start:506 stop:1333 length:828 start_codon:yes stop_codon:yes gene_type:complete